MPCKKFSFFWDQASGFAHTSRLVYHKWKALVLWQFCIIVFYKWFMPWNNNTVLLSNINWKSGIVMQLMRPQTLCSPRRSFHTCNSLSCLRIDPRMSITFKCDVCNEKSTKTFSKEAYEKGMVIITCPKCKSNHLISNNLTKYKDLG